MAAKYVAPFRTSAKNDLNDAVAICVAVARPSTRFSFIQISRAKAVLLLHRARENWGHEHTGLFNQIRAMLAGFGIIAPIGRHALQHAVPDSLEDTNYPI